MHARVIVEAHTCRSRGAHVACTRTYSGQCARKKIRPRMCTYGGVSNAYSRMRTTRARVHGWVGTEKLRRVHREPTGLDGTADGNEAWRTAERRKRPCVRPTTVKTGSCSSGGVWHTAKRRKRTSLGRNRVLLIGRGVAYRKTEETDFLRSKWGSC